MFKTRFHIMPEVTNAGKASPEMREVIHSSIDRFLNKDYGLISEHEKERNLINLRDRWGHIEGLYNTPTGDICIILVFGIRSIEAVVMYTRKGGKA